MPLPPLPKYPALGVNQETFALAEWQSFQDGCITLTKAYLLSNHETFAREAYSSSSLQTFLESFVASTAATLTVSHGTRTKVLMQHCFLLVHRLCSAATQAPEYVLKFEFLGDLSTVYSKVPALTGLIEALWKNYNLDTNPDLLKSKNKIILHLETMSADKEGDGTLRRVCALLHSSIDYGRFLMIGSDFMDALMIAWKTASLELKKKLITITYTSLMSLVEGQTQSLSLLVDHLYTLKTENEKNAHELSILNNLLSTTPLLRRLENSTIVAGSGRATPIVQYFQTLNISTSQRKRSKKSLGKRKHPSQVEFGHDALSDLKVQRLSLVTELQDLFPDLGSGFLLKLLNEYKGDVETVTAHLLDNALPSHLQLADRTEVIAANFHDTSMATNKSTSADIPPTQEIRRNVFDGDDFDKLNIDLGKVHIGHKEAEPALSAPNKASILAALAAFDSDDDERDDTFDVADVGDTIDNTEPISDKADINHRVEASEEALYTAWKMSPNIFARDNNTRRSNARNALKSETGMTDEALEGWAIMLERDPAKLKRLEARFSNFSGEQTQLAPTAWRAGDDNDDNDDVTGASSGTRETSNARGRGRGRYGNSRGSGRGRGRGDVTGPSADKTTQAARQNKDAHKSQRANHNRRLQRAKKVSRAGYPNG